MTIDPDDPRLRIDTLTWAAVDPDRHPFDPGTVLDVVRRVAPAGGVPAPYRYDPARGFDRAADDARWEWQRAMALALVEHYGSWACGWNAEVAGHTADGALALRWSGARDSITTPEETLGAVAGALLDWRMFLEDLAEIFPRHLPLPAEPRAAFVAWEATVASLVATGRDQGRCTTAAADQARAHGGRLLHGLGSGQVEGVKVVRSALVLFSRGPSSSSDVAPSGDHVPWMRAAA